MNSEQKKFLDENGLKILWNQISMQDYPNNTALTSIINTINTNKADKADIPNIDTTLSKSGAAADAKITGEAINNLSDLAQTQVNWEQNDETAIDFIKGRTHYVQEGIYLPVADFTMTSQTYSNPPVLLSYYTDYRITINDISYESRSDDYGCIYLRNNGVLIFGIYEIGSEDNVHLIAELGDMYAGQQCHIIIEEIVKKEELKQLDERYIPNTIARVSEIPEPSNVYIGEQEPIDENIELWIDPTVENIQPIYPPDTATIGQTIVVKSVDENGKPTEWEAADMASGGSPEIRHIKTLTLEDDVQWAYVDTDEDGNAFHITEVVINVYSVGAESNTGEAYLKVVVNNSNYISGNQIADINSGIRKAGSSRSMTIMIVSNGVTAFAVHSAADNENLFDADMLFDGKLANTAQHSCGIYGCKSIESLMFGSDTAKTVLGTGTKIAIWGR